MLVGNALPVLSRLGPLREQTEVAPEERLFEVMEIAGQQIPRERESEIMAGWNPIQSFWLKWAMRIMAYPAHRDIYIQTPIEAGDHQSLMVLLAGDPPGFLDGQFS